MLNSKEGGVMSNDVANAFGNLVRTISKQLPKRLKLTSHDEIDQAMFKYITADKNIEHALVNPFSQKISLQINLYIPVI